MAAGKMLLALVLLCNLLVVSCATTECTDANIDQCIAPLKKYGNSNDSIVPSYTIGVVVQMCRTYEDVRDCMHKFQDKCETIEKRWFQGVHDTYEYLCETHFEEYKKHQACLATPALHIEGHACNWTLHRTLASTHYQNGDNKYKVQRICQYAKTYLSCVEILVTSFCGKEAGAWQRGYDEASLHPILAFIGCPLRTVNYSQTAILSGTILTAILVILFIVVVIFAYIYGKRKRALRVRECPERGPGPNNYSVSPNAAQNVVYSVGGPGANPQLSFGYLSPNPPPYAHVDSPPNYTEQANGFVHMPPDLSLVDQQAPALRPKLPLPPPKSEVPVGAVGARGGSKYETKETSASEYEQPVRTLGNQPALEATASTESEYIEISGATLHASSPDSTYENVP